MNQISFSVIVPVYNKEKQIKRSIKSILEQTYKNFELIIVCDPSTDNSNIEIEKFKDDRIRIFYRNEAGSGGYAARNLGINESKSEWIAFLDADDEWYPTHLEEAKNIILNNKNISFVFFNFNMVINNKIKIEHKIKHNKVLKRFDLLKLYSKQQLMHTNSIVVDRKLIMQAGMFPEGKAKRGGDSDLWLRLMLNCSYAIWSYKSTSCYHFDDSGVIKNHKTLGEKHIIYNTVNEYLKKFDNLSNQEKKYLYKISNRKCFEVSIARKRFNIFKYKELYVYYFRYFNISEYLKYFLLLMPSIFIKFIYKIKVYLSNQKAKEL